MEQAWGISMAWKEDKPLLEINYSAPFMGGMWGFLSQRTHTSAPGTSTNLPRLFTVSVGTNLTV